MKVPLAGQHEIPPQAQTVFESEPHVEQKPPAPSAARPVEIEVPPSAKVSPPPAPLEPPSGESSFGIIRFLPYMLALLFVGIIIMLGTRLIPGVLHRGGTIELTYWGLWEEQNVINTIITDYQKDHANVKITYEKQNVKQYRETLTNRLSQGTGPDIFRFHNTWGPMVRDLVEPVPDNIYSADQFQNTFYPIAENDLKFGKGYLGIPLEIDTLALFINTDDFKAAGLAPPKTWDELRKDATTLTIKNSTGAIQKAGVALGTFDNIDQASDILALMMIQNGVDFKKVDKSLSQKGDNLGADTLAYYTSFAQGEGKTWDDTLDPSTLAFAKEKLSMYFGYSWRIFQIRSLNPSLTFQVVPPPQLPGITKTFASYWVEGVSKKSRHPKEAFAFLAYLSKRETMQKLFSEQSKLRQFGEPYSRVDLADTLKSNSDVWPFLELAKDASSWYLASDTYDNGLNDGMIKYFADAIRAVEKNVSPTTALETVAKGVALVATQYGL